MKKLSLIALIVSLFVVGLVNVNAMSESDLQKKFEETLTLNGDKYGLSSGDITLVERYLSKYDVSSEHADFISARIDKAKSIIENDGHAKFADFSESTKQQLRALVKEINDQTSVKATTTKNSVIVYNSDGTTFAEITKLVKQTGAETSNTAIIACISLIIVAAGTCLVIRQTITSK